MQEFTFTTEREAVMAQRGFISRGVTVSLIAYDPERDVYVFDATL